jgi:uncharacterized protein YggE
LSAAAMKKAFDKATAMASAVGHAVLGIRNASDSSQMPERIQTMNFSQDWMAQETARSTKRRLEIGTEFKTTREISDEVIVEFYLEKSEPSPETAASS